jgi:hypothetical protein
VAKVSVMSRFLIGQKDPAPSIGSVLALP